MNVYGVGDSSGWLCDRWLAIIAKPVSPDQEWLWGNPLLEVSDSDSELSATPTATAAPTRMMSLPSPRDSSSSDSPLRRRGSDQDQGQEWLWGNPLLEVSDSDIELSATTTHDDDGDGDDGEEDGEDGEGEDTVTNLHTHAPTPPQWFLFFLFECSHVCGFLPITHFGLLPSAACFSIYNSNPPHHPALQNFHEQAWHLITGKRGARMDAVLQTLCAAETKSDDPSESRCNLRERMWPDDHPWIVRLLKYWMSPYCHLHGNHRQRMASLAKFLAFERPQCDTNPADELVDTAKIIGYCDFLAENGFAPGTIKKKLQIIDLVSQPASLIAHLLPTARCPLTYFAHSLALLLCFHGRLFSGGFRLSESAMTRTQGMWLDASKRGNLFKKCRQCGRRRATL